MLLSTRAECAFKVMELTKVSLPTLGSSSERVDERPLARLQVYRQDHPAFIATLAKIRRGICDDECIAFLKTCGTELGRGGNIKIQVRCRKDHFACETSSF